MGMVVFGGDEWKPSEEHEAIERHQRIDAPDPIDVTEEAFPTADGVLVRGRPDLHKRITSASILDPGVQLASKPDTAVVLEVLAVGDGAVLDGKQRPIPHKVGDLVVANGFFRGPRMYVQRAAHYLFASEWIMGKINPHNLEVEPQEGHLMTRTADKRMRDVVAGKDIQTVDGKLVRIHLPVNDTDNNGGDGFNEDDRRDPDKITYEEVVHAGTGPVLENGQRQTPRWRVGDLVAFSHAAVALRITIAGKSYTLLPWSHVRMALRDKAAAEELPPTLRDGSAQG
jgi:co-chaperonin GroES (HSP10)